jgi:hypothetical protein
VIFGVGVVPAHPTASHTTREATVIRLIVSYLMIRSLAIRTADTLEDGRAEPSVRDQNRSRALELVCEWRRR